ncbi:hypothetical protein IVB45_02160 [Bradyrhizobium sp. 4]|uniref:hypothetical protein n=1 Tax=Bradyrhizobium sp. 4 TaxID=2782678 RepID=UPI001FFF7D95|nr:hypothetical protein [Bradyrhizobium sp. 4]UPJ35838.1 hypothetical protein IVB45_02160 [Bradyrhizobium sp. 4]
MKQESLFWWHRDGSIRVSAKGGYASFQIPENTELEVDEHCSAFTVAELGEMLKKYSKDGLYAGLNGCALYGDWEQTNVGRRRKYIYNELATDNEANDRAKMLIYLIENKLLTI